MANGDKNLEGGFSLGLKNKKSVAVVIFLTALSGVLKVWLGCAEVKDVAVVLTICFTTMVMAGVVAYFCWLQFLTDKGKK